MLDLYAIVLIIHRKDKKDNKECSCLQNVAEHTEVSVQPIGGFTDKCTLISGLFAIYGHMT